MTLLRVYLDQNKWIDLSRAVYGRPGGARFRDALDVVRYGVEKGLASFPLSSMHYMETLKRRDANSRRRLAAVMAEMSKMHTLAPPNVILPAELDAALNRRYGKPRNPRPMKAFGIGHRHAFGLPEGRSRLPESAEVPPEQRWAVEEWANTVLELGLLAGPPKGVAVPGMKENDYYRAFGDRYARGEERLARGMVQNGLSKQVLREWVAGSEFVDILDAINEAFDRAGITEAESQNLETAQGMTGLLLDLPSRAITYHLRRLRHENPNTSWEPTDLDDISALAVAIAYCHVVITERQWSHFARIAQLGDQFGTTIISDLSQLPEILARGAPED
jgi:hypothetical protein